MVIAMWSRNEEFLNPELRNGKKGRFAERVMGIGIDA